MYSLISVLLISESKFSRVLFLLIFNSAFIEFEISFMDVPEIIRESNELKSSFIKAIDSVSNSS